MESKDRREGTRSERECVAGTGRGEVVWERKVVRCGVWLVRQREEARVRALEREVGEEERRARRASERSRGNWMKQCMVVWEIVWLVGREVGMGRVAVRKGVVSKREGRPR